LDIGIFEIGIRQSLCLTFDGVESEFFGWGFVGCDELLNGVEDNLEVLIVFFLKFFDFFSEEFIGLHQGTELDEGPHDGDVNLDGSGRA
jgi:hypothetical protein